MVAVLTACWPGAPKPPDELVRSRIVGDQRNRPASFPLMTAAPIATARDAPFAAVLDTLSIVSRFFVEVMLRIRFFDIGLR